MGFTKGESSSFIMAMPEERLLTNRANKMLKRKILNVFKKLNNE